MAYERELQVAIEAVRRAAGVCQAIQAEITPDVLAKKDRSPVTVADYSSQALVCKDLGDAFPDDPIIAEEDAHALRQEEQVEFLARVVSHVGKMESGAGNDQILSWIDRGGANDFTNRFWTLDPIDGTKGFLRGEQYAVALGLIVNGEVVVGVLGCPNLPWDSANPTAGGSIFTAVKGAGAQVTPLLGGGEARPVEVSPQTDPAQTRFCESVESGHSDHSEAAQIAAELKITAAGVRLDSQAKYAVVSRGEAEIYLRLPTRADYREKIWDHAAGVLVVTEAGGTVTDITGKSLDFTRGRELSENRGVIVTNGIWHEKVLAAVQKVVKS